MSGRLNGKTAVVTGASKGIGAAIARRLAADGAAVVVNYASSKAEADKVVAEIARNGGRAVAIQANIAEKDDVVRLFAETKKQFGQVDVLVNNAGIYEMAPLEEISAEHFHKQFNLNVLGLITATQEALRIFNKNGGSIINISSVVSTFLPPQSAVYSATKAAVDAITGVFSKELGARKIRVNAINPGMIETEGTRSAGILDSDFRTEIEKSTPLGRIGQPQDIASAASFLASEDSAWVSGETILLSGGFR